MTKEENIISIDKGIKSSVRGRKKILFELIVEKSFFLCACTAVLSIAVITVYIFAQGLPVMIKIGVIDFVTGHFWRPLENQFGILPMIVVSLIGTLGAVVLGTVVGLFTAIFLAEIAPDWLIRIFRPAVELLAGIPSVVYGFFGLIVIVPLIRNTFGGPGNSLLAVIIILAIMILPTIISISEISLRSVPKEYKEGSLALGASQIKTIFKVMLPAASSGILASIVLGTGRAIGETMAVLLVAGNTPVFPESILSPVRTLTVNIAMEMGYAQGMHREALFATGVVLFIFIIVLNVALNLTIYKKESRI
ncbi:MAG: phosphate ABC transporter permease subunit PstC [Clostridia bacterium]|nr:phosphate ABC transporter permease subunit PstC [Clostridia bacterium]MDD4048169.1 phosphate ABC transporter permease subunit PstC [Clostridia bacterium]